MSRGMIYDNLFIIFWYGIVTQRWIEDLENIVDQPTHRLITVLTFNSRRSSQRDVFSHNFKKPYGNPHRTRGHGVGDDTKERDALTK